MPAVQTTKTYLRAQQIIHGALTMGMFTFTVMVLVMLVSGLLETTPIIDKTTALIISGASAAVLLSAARFIFNQRLNVLRTKPLAEKTKAYTTTHIIRCALIETAAMISLVLAFLNGYLELLIVPGLMVVYMISLFPTQKRLINDLQPDYKEMAILENPEGIF